MGPVTVIVVRAGFSGCTRTQVPVCVRTSSRTCSSVSVRTAATALRTRAANARSEGPSHGPTGPSPTSGVVGSPSRIERSTLRACVTGSPTTSSASTRARPGSIRPPSSRPRVVGSTVTRVRETWTSCSAWYWLSPVAAATSCPTSTSRSWEVMYPPRVTHCGVRNPSHAIARAWVSVVIA